MDISTGEIFSTNMRGDFFNESQKALREWEKEDIKHRLVELSDDEVTELLPLSREKRKGRMRNKPCVCGSGIKFKRCCWNNYK